MKDSFKKFMQTGQIKYYLQYRTEISKELTVNQKEDKKEDKNKK